MKQALSKYKKLALLAVSTGMIFAGSGVVNAQTTPTTSLTWFSDVNWWTLSKWNTNPDTVEGAITKKFGLTFNFNVPAASGDTKLNLELVAGQLPDIITLQSGAAESQLISSGKVWNLQQFFQKYYPDYLHVFPQDLISLENRQYGGFYSVPSYAGTPGLQKLYPPKPWAARATLASNSAVVFNQHIMKQAGIKASQLTTEAGVLAALKKVESMHLTYKGAPVVPLQIDNKDSWMWSSVDNLAQMFGAMPVDHAGNYQDLMFAPQTKAAIEFYFHAAQDGALNQSDLTLDTNGTNNVFRSGRVFCFIGNIGNIHASTMWQSDPTETFVSPGPILLGFNHPTFGLQKYGLGWTQTYVSKTAPDPQAIAKWLAFMYSAPGQLLINDGFPGKDYHIEKDGVVIPTPAMSKLPNNYWETTGLGAMWFFYNSAWGAATSPPPAGETALMHTQIYEAYATNPKTHIYDSTALEMPATLIPPGSQMFQEQQQINLYEQSQVAKMIFAPNQAVLNQTYNATIAQLKQMGLPQIDAKINGVFHKQEAALHEHIVGINP